MLYKLFKNTINYFKIAQTIPDLSKNISKLGSYYLVNVSDSQIHAGSMEYDINIGFAKALSEFIERNAFRENLKKCDSKDLYGHGYAAFPKGEDGLTYAKDQALFEATERYAWPLFWHEDIAFEHQTCQSNKFKLLVKLSKDIKDCYHILPCLGGEVIFAITVITLKQGGVSVGGKCSFTVDSAIEGSFKEALRHFVIYKNIRNEFHLRDQFYQKRLCHLAEHGEEMYLNRLNRKSNKRLDIPKLWIDKQIQHSFDHMYYVNQKCYKSPYTFLDSVVEVGYI